MTQENVEDLLDVSGTNVCAGERATIQGRYLYVPCVYVWRRGHRVLYVGSSVRGLDRPTAYDRHVIGKLYQVEPADEIECTFYPGISKDDLRAKEDELIRYLKPSLNAAGHRGRDRQVVCAIETERIVSLPKEDRAKALWEAMQRQKETDGLPLARASRRLREAGH